MASDEWLVTGRVDFSQMSEFEGRRRGANDKENGVGIPNSKITHGASPLERPHESQHRVNVEFSSMNGIVFNF